ncbi:MAG: hypothetical protein RBT22_12030 [Aliarcobacter sp.]|jgi:hypothetical protein|nr:hypothetical protein [Aliarcobacter sp.]
MATQLEPIVVTAEEENKQLEFEDIKDYLNAIEAGLSNFYDNTNFPDIGRLFQSYAIYDKLNTFSEIISDSDISGKLGFEASKMASALGGMKAGVAIAVNSPAPWTKHPLAILFAGSAGAYLGEAGVEQFETQIRNATNDLVNLFDTYGADSNTFQQAYSKSMLDLKTLALNSGFTPALQSKTLADELFGKLDSVASNYSVKNLTSNSNLSSLQQTTYLENGKPTTLFYSQDSNLLMHGDTIDNPNKISFVNEDGSYEVWEKVNGEFTQSIKIDIAPTKTLDLNSITTVSGGYGAIVNVKDTSGNDIFIVPDEYGNVSVYDNNGQLDVLQASSILNVLSSDNISDFSDTQQNISYVWNKNLISENFYSTLSRNIRNYLINESPSNDYSFTQNTTDTNTNPTTIFDLASQYNVSVSQLEAQNPWLKDRTSDSLPSVFNNSSYNTINIENNTGISYNYTYDDTSDSNQSGSINEDEIVQKVSFIKSKQIRFYQANSKKVA